MRSPRTGVTRREFSIGLAISALWPAARASRAVAAAPLFDFAIAGGWYHGLKSVLAQLGPGVLLRLVREPENPYDADAVAVYLGDVKLGFVPRTAVAPVARLLDGGEPVSAEVVGTISAGRSAELPSGLVLTSATAGDPVVRLTTVRTA